MPSHYQMGGKPKRQKKTIKASQKPKSGSQRRLAKKGRKGKFDIAFTAEARYKPHGKPGTAKGKRPTTAPAKEASSVTQPPKKRKKKKTSGPAKFETSRY